MRRYLLLSPIALALVGTVFAQKTATTIPIVNPGFEDDVLACGAGVDCDASPLTGWLCGPDAGVFKPSTAQFPNGIPGGTNVAYLGRGLNTIQTGSILQVVGATVQANTTYTLKLSVGARADVGFTGYSAALLAGNVTLAYDNSLAPAPGTFLTDAIVYNSGAAPPQLGQRLQILVRSVGTGQVDIDNVSLTAAPE
ncbi:MAG TPA: hypothetical protein VN924_31605 [Bryobacteraceae bacterium]|nr:hypothetical protein [Bryobacteraceae bacterium]